MVVVIIVVVSTLTHQSHICQVSRRYLHSPSSLSHWVTPITSRACDAKKWKYDIRYRCWKRRMKRTFWWSIINQFGRLVPILLPPATQPRQRLAAQLENIWKAKTVAKVDRQRWWWSTMWLESTTQNGQFWGSPRVERSIHTGRSNPWPSECLPRIVGEWLSSAAFSCIDTVVAIISECCDNVVWEALLWI